MLVASAKQTESVFLTQRVHPYPFRTRKLSFAVPKILSWRRLGKIGHGRHTIKVALCATFMQYSSLAQSVEHMTVNHGVVGSSPTGGARKKPNAYALGFFQWSAPAVHEASCEATHEAGLRPIFRCYMSKIIFLKIFGRDIVSSADLCYNGMGDANG